MKNMSKTVEERFQLEKGLSWLGQKLGRCGVKGSVGRYKVGVLIYNTPFEYAEQRL